MGNYSVPESINQRELWSNGSKTATTFITTLRNRSLFSIQMTINVGRPKPKWVTA